MAADDPSEFARPAMRHRMNAAENAIADLREKNNRIHLAFAAGLSAVQEQVAELQRRVLGAEEVRRRAEVAARGPDPGVTRAKLHQRALDQERRS
jgi:hypothetical protein